MIVVDAHQHFWRLSRGDYTWLTPALDALYSDFEPEDLAPLLVQKDIGATVVVQAAATEAETRFLLELAGKHAFIKGVVGWTDFSSPNAAQNIATLVDIGDGKLKGLRPMLQDIADPNWVRRHELNTAFTAMVEHDLAFDALVKPRHFFALLARMRQHPNLRVVIDHAGNPDVANGGFDLWALHLEKLARETGAFCKLSGLLTGAAPDATAADLAPYVKHVFACFGPHRVIWGSDWPVLNLASDYASWFNMAHALVSRFAGRHKAAVFGLTAASFYRLHI